MDNRLPNLVNLNEDPQLSEVLLYMIKEGETTVGRYTANSKHDIQLSGVLIADDHWYVVFFLSFFSFYYLCQSRKYFHLGFALGVAVTSGSSKIWLSNYRG